MRGTPSRRRIPDEYTIFIPRYSSLIQFRDLFSPFASRILADCTPIKTDLLDSILLYFFFLSLLDAIHNVLEKLQFLDYFSILFFEIIHVKLAARRRDPIPIASNLSNFPFSSKFPCFHAPPLLSSFVSQQRKKTRYTRGSNILFATRGKRKRKRKIKKKKKERTLFRRSIKHTTDIGIIIINIHSYTSMLLVNRNLRDQMNCGRKLLYTCLVVGESSLLPRLASALRASRGPMSVLAIAESFL